MKDGSIVEQGSHDDLIAANHIYFDLFKNYQQDTSNFRSSAEVNIQESSDFSAEIIGDQAISGKAVSSRTVRSNNVS